MRKSFACSFRLSFGRIISPIDLFYGRFIVSAAEAWELSSLAHKLANIKEHLEKQIGICNHKIGELQANQISPNYTNVCK